MRAEIISIGDELLIGQTINTNAAWIGAELSKLGFLITRMVSIPDKKEDILKALGEAEGKVDAVLITGGLGPTSDDITKPVLCDFFETKLVTDDVVLRMIEKMMSGRNFPMNENNRRQAEVPESCKVLYNSTGTAPGMWFEKERTIFVSMPGVPMEMKHLMTEHVLPELGRRFHSQVIVHKNIMTYGTPEAKLAEILTGFEAGLPRSVSLAYLPSYGIIKLRLTGKGTDRDNTEREIDEQVKNLYRKIPELIYAEDEETMEMTIGRLLTGKNSTLCTAESCTGGNIARMITSVSGSSKYYTGSVIAYDNKVKTGQLKVPDELIVKYGAVSPEVAESMAKGARELFATDYSVAVTGIAGPDGGKVGKPVGTVYISVSSKGNIITQGFTFGGDRNINIMRFSVAALNMLRKQILDSK
jgi:nicotinamide-nucleotide amidase